MSSNSESKSETSIFVPAFLRTDERSKRIRCLTPLAASTVPSSECSYPMSGLSKPNGLTCESNSMESTPSGNVA